MSEGMFFAVRTIGGKEEQALDFLYDVIERNSYPIYSIIHPYGLRGYIYVEADSYDVVREAIRGVPYTRGVVKHSFSFSEIENDLTVTKQEYNILKNDIVEIITGTFKHEKAKVIRVDLNKKVVVVEFLDSPTPIPVTLPIDSVKVIRRDVDLSEIHENTTK